MSSSDQQDSVESDRENLNDTILESTHQDVEEDVPKKIVQLGTCVISQQKIGKSDDSKTSALRADMHIKSLSNRQLRRLECVRDTQYYGSKHRTG